MQYKVEIEVDPSVQENPDWARRVEQANATLQDVIGRTYEPANARWTVNGSKNGSRILCLRLTDFASSVEEAFLPEELDGSQQLWFRMNHLWGDLLQNRSHKRLEHLLSTQAGEE